LVSTFGVSAGATATALGAGDVILVVASDLHQEAPLWWLRTRQAVVERGAKLIVLNARPTRLDEYAGDYALRAYQTAPPGNACLLVPLTQDGEEYLLVANRGRQVSRFDHYTWTGFSPSFRSRSGSSQITACR